MQSRSKQTPFTEHKLQTNINLKFESIGNGSNRLSLKLIRPYLLTVFE